MGQRHQVIVIYPEMFLNAGNQNNKPQRAEVFHHQWLYGRSAILSLERALTLVKNMVSEGTDYMFGTDGRGYTGGDGTNALAAAYSVDPEIGYYHRVHVWEDADYNGMENNATDPRKLTSNMFDNNDGITVLQFHRGKKKPSYAFITPGHLEGKEWHDSDGYGPWSAKEYLEFYYNKADQKAWDTELQASMRKSLRSISSKATLLTKEEVKTLFPKFKI